ncbi:MAG: LysM peptidoglycan-binding domain-containing protein, partial [Mycobacterium leprae]
MVATALQVESFTATRSAGRRSLPRRATMRQRRMITLAVLFTLVVLGLLLAFPPIVHTASRSIEPHTVQYTVARGDTLWQIAEQYAGGGDVRKIIETIKETNHLRSAVVQPGQVLLIPVAP